MTPSNPEPRIIAFTCNWAPYACLDRLGAQGESYPPGILLIPVTCAGRMNTSIMLKSFLQGADGVMLLHCRKKNCHYGPGPEQAAFYVPKVKAFLDLLGIEPERFISLEYEPEETEKLKEDLLNFHDRLSRLSPFREKYGAPK